MSECKWTDGPWIKVIGKAFVYALDENGVNRFQLSVDGAHCPESELEANAQLVAAAPDLYAALESAAKLLKYVVEEYPGHAPDLHKCNAALAKARGESQ